MLSIVAAALAASLIQFTALNYARIGPFAIDLQIIILVFFSLRKGPKTGLVLGLVFGLFNSFFHQDLFWTNLFLYLIAGFAIGYAGRWFYKENLAAFIIMFFCAFTVMYFSFYFLGAKSGIELNVLDYAARLFLPAAGYNIAAALFLFYFLKRF